MIIGAKDIYEEIAEEENINLELIQSIGNAVFQNLRTCLNDPLELSYELPKIGTFNIRFKKFENYKNNQFLTFKNNSNKIKCIKVIQI